MIEIAMNAARKNALGTEMMTYLIGRLREADGAPVLLTGTGDAFSAGLDLKEVGALDAAGMERFLRLLEECMSALYLYGGPTVACVNGHAIAGGAVLTLCCDRRVASTNARIKIGLNEVPLGLRFPPRVLAIVKDRVPRRHHEEVLLQGALLDPANALRAGIVDELADDALAVARERLGALAALPRDAYRATKAMLRGESASDLASDAELDAELKRILPVWTSPELKARVAKVLAR